MVEKLTRRKNSERRTSLYDMLRPQLKVALKIFEAGDDGTYFSKLVNDLHGEVSRMTVSEAIDTLLDIGVITGKWTKREIISKDGKRRIWVRAYNVSGEHYQTCLNLLHKFKTQTKVEV